VPELATRSRTGACSSQEIQGMGKCAHRMCVHFGLVRDAPVLTFPKRCFLPLRAFGAIGPEATLRGIQ
jgi:hypothetical protein